MRRSTAATIILSISLLPAPLAAQFVLSGRVNHPVHDGSSELVPIPTILVFASRRDAESEAISFRTWETEPAGWFRLSGLDGAYTAVFSNPAHYFRPVVLTNLRFTAGERIVRNVSPRLEHAVLDLGVWDPRPATRYVQPFRARGRSITAVGFRLAHDGVDGMGPGSQDLVVSIHRQGPGTPDGWEAVGPAMVVPAVDSGGAKNYLWSAGWNSGEVPTLPGEVYAVQVTARTPGGAFQAFWRRNDDGSIGCYRAGSDGAGFTGCDLHLAIAGDGDGLVIPYNKRVHAPFPALTRMQRRWTQTYRAKGRGLAAVLLYAAVSGAQPPIQRQRVRVRALFGGCGGPQVGASRIAIGNGYYTGDASWGVYGVAFAPGDVPLVQGETYALELENIEGAATLDGFVNIKGQVSDGRAGFNPYRKHAEDAYEMGAAFDENGNEMDFDLDLQVIEYEDEAPRWDLATAGPDLLANGSMDETEADADGKDAAAGGALAAWKPFSLAGESEIAAIPAGEGEPGRVARIRGRSPGSGADREVGLGPVAPPFDAGIVQLAGGLSRSETYRLAGRLRASWPGDAERHALVGVDPTGQVSDPEASTIVWSAAPGSHGVWVEHLGEPLRPADSAISVWLRARQLAPSSPVLAVEFDDFRLRRVATGAPDSTVDGEPR